MVQIQSRLLQVVNGFKPFEEEAKKIVGAHTVAYSKQMALDVIDSEFYQVRSYAVFILGLIAVKDKSVLTVLKKLARKDPSWQVQEIIAKAFDQFCSDNGYEESLPQIRGWLNDRNPNVCRAVTEGLRVWTGRPYFKEHPEQAVELIAHHKGSKSEYLRKSVGNALRDVGKKHPQLIQDEIATWDLDDTKVAFTYQYVLKRH